MKGTSKAQVIALLRWPILACCPLFSQHNSSNCVRIISKKYDGQLRSENHPKDYALDGVLVEVFSEPGTPFMNHKINKWQQSENGLIEMYFSDRWYNLMHIFEHRSHDYAMYINLAMPAIISNEEVSWIDMDLDYKVGLDGRVELIDEDEFEENKKLLVYPDDVIKKIEEQAGQLPALIQEGAFPFNYAEQKARYQRWREARADEGY